jgi:glycosyltransferase involved in cell wall biosynthesis
MGNPLPSCGRRPTVTIITPAYNARAFLRETIASANRQTFVNFEHLVVDDGSTDDTAKIAEDCAAADQRVRVIKQRNAGAAAARNAAIACAAGDYFALLDADDLWMPDFLAAQLAILAANPDVDIVSANAINLGGPFDGQPLKPASATCTRLSLLDMIEIEDSVCITSVFRRRIVDRIGGFDPAIIANEDYDFWLRAAAGGCQVLFNARPCAFYRRHPGGKSANEQGALRGIVGVLRKARALPGVGAREAQAIDRQIARFERRLLIVGARVALNERDLERSRGFFRQLAQRDANDAFQLIAEIGRRLPRLVLWGYKAKIAFRKCRQHLRFESRDAARRDAVV